MKTIITLDIVRFNDKTDSERSCYILGESTVATELKSVLIEKLEGSKDSIVAAAASRYEDGEEDGHEADRAATYNDVIERINAATSIKDFSYFGRFELEDGVDIDTDEQIISHITIWSEEATQL